MKDVQNSLLLSKVVGCLYGGAIGDAMGAPAEWYLPEQIKERYGTITDFVENWQGKSDIGKGDGRYTDDSHMVQLLCHTYLEEAGHLDAFSFARRFVPKIVHELRYIPEYGKNMHLIDRLFYPEKWLYMRLTLANADPRQGGIGNMVNCGAAMYAAPVGIINAGDPLNAYREAIEIFSAHQQSYGLEAAAVMASCVAEAFKPTATVTSIIETALSLAKEGTYNAIKAVIACAQQYSDWQEAIQPLREAMQPYDGSAEHRTMRGNGTNDWQPSREHSIEELPIALAFLVVTKGDFETSVFGAVNYGRDNDSIAGMAGAIAGALHGSTAIRSQWIEQIKQANRIDLDPLARDMAVLSTQLQQQQLQEVTARQQTFIELAKETT